MARLIANTVTSGAQVIVETHSDHVLNGIRVAVKQQILNPSDVTMHYFRQSNGAIEIVSPTVGPTGKLSAWPDGFFDEWDRLLDELID